MAPGIECTDVCSVKLTLLVYLSTPPNVKFIACLSSVSLPCSIVNTSVPSAFFALRNLAINSVFTLKENGSEILSTIQKVSFNLKLEGNGSYNLIYKLGNVVLTLSKATLTPI